MANRGRPRKPEPSPTEADAADHDWLRSVLERVKKAEKASEPGEKGYKDLIITAGIAMTKLKELRGKGGPPPKPAVVIRPKFGLDKAGPPKK